MNAPLLMRGTLRPLRPHQERALEALRRSLAARHTRPMLQAPTGFGKTLLAAHIIRGALDKRNRLIFVVPALSLVDQTVAALEAEGIHCVGVMQGYHDRTDHMQPVQVCSIQTLARRQKPGAAIVLIDEAHLMFKSILQWMEDPAWAHVPFIDLSATPWEPGLGKYFDDLIIAATTDDLIRDGYLSKFIIYAPSNPDLSDVSTARGDFHQAQLGEAMDEASLVGDIVLTWLKRGKGLPTLCYCVNRQHAKHITECFLEAGIASEYMDGDTAREDRGNTFERFRYGQTKVICNVGVLTTGVDLDVRCIVEAKPTKSRILFVQTIGRGLRTAPGKDSLIILDHAGNHLRLGMVTDIGQEHLNDGSERHGSAKRSQERKEPLPRLCEACKAVVPHVAERCPACGSPIIATTEVHAQDGELVQLGSRRSGKREPSYSDKQSFYAELKSLKKPDYKSGWVAVKFKERFGEWPPREFSSLPAQPASLEARNWLKSRWIAQARGRAHG